MKRLALATSLVTLLVFGFAAAATAQSSVSETFQQRLETEPEPGQIGLVTCSLGDRIDLRAKGVSRVAVDNASIVKVTANEADTVLHLDCAKAGTVIVTVTRGDSEYRVAVQVPRS